MRAFEKTRAVVAPLDRANVDTDQIIPKQFLRAIGKTGYGPFLFDQWRYLDRGEIGMDCARRPRNADFALNDSRYEGAGVLLARQNFGCGSSARACRLGARRGGFSRRRRAVFRRDFSSQRDEKRLVAGRFADGGC